MTGRLLCFVFYGYSITGVMAQKYHTEIEECCGNQKDEIRQQIRKRSMDRKAVSDISAFICEGNGT